MKIFWTTRAVEDLKSISRFIALDDLSAARRFAGKLKHQAESVCRFPNRGRILPELGRDDVREMIAGNYRIVYRVRKGAVDILTIFEGHRLFRGIDFQE